MVAVDAEGNQLNVKAKRGVVLACGGFENNKQMLNAFYPPNVPIYPCGTPYNTGRRACAWSPRLGRSCAGSARWNGGCHCCKPAADEVGVSCGFTWTRHGMLEQRHHGQPSRPALRQRVCRKRLRTAASCVRSTTSPSCPSLLSAWTPSATSICPCFLVCDDTKVQAGPVFNNCTRTAGNHWANIHEWYTWSDDNQAEIEKGWLVKADTLEELAEKAGHRPCGPRGDGGDLQRRLRCGPSIRHTGRGQRVHAGEHAAVLRMRAWSGAHQHAGRARPGRRAPGARQRQQPIPRLYAGGEFGSIYSWLYQGGRQRSRSLGRPALPAPTQPARTRGSSA